MNHYPLITNLYLVIYDHRPKSLMMIYDFPIFTANPGVLDV